MKVADEIQFHAVLDAEKQHVARHLVPFGVVEFAADEVALRPPGHQMGSWLAPAGRCLEFEGQVMPYDRRGAS